MCSCGCSPCCCDTSGETDPTECLDPGIVKSGSYLHVLAENLCPRRLMAFRGLRADGSPVTDTSQPLLPGIAVQDAEGVVKWTNQSVHLPPTDQIRVANDEQATDDTNFIPYIIGKDADGKEFKLVGTSDTNTGQWKSVWISAKQKWTTVPDVEADVTDLCTLLASDTVLNPTGASVLELESVEHIAVGVSVKTGEYEMYVTEIIDEDYIRVEMVTVLAGPVTLRAGASLCNIGFRPCPRSTAAYVQNLVGCVDNNPKGFTFPADVNSVPVPGLFWRDQLGQITFLAAPVNGTTGLVTPDFVLKLPSAPVAGNANKPSFVQFSQKPTWLSGKIVVGSKYSGSPAAPSFAIEDDLVSATPHSGTFDMTTVPGYVSGSGVAIVRAITFADVGPSGTEALSQVQLNGLVLMESWIDSALNFAYKNDSVLEVPLTNNAFTFALIANGDGVAFSKLEIIGFK